MSLYGYICWLFIAVQTLLIAVHMPTMYSRDQLLPLRASATLLNHDQRLRITELGLRRRGCRAGNHTRRSRQAARRVTSSTSCTSTRGEIPVIIGHRPLFTNNDQLTSTTTRDKSTSRPNLLSVPLQKQTTLPRHCAATSFIPPTLYVLNVAAITKPHAIEHVAADLLAYNVDIAVICETHLKKKHFDHSFVIDGYSLFRRDRLGRRGGGVAVYVSSRMSAEVWTPPCDNIDFELLWVTILAGGRKVFVGALYHPPKPIYQPVLLVDYLERCLDAIAAESPSALTIIAGDFNSLSNDDIIASTALLSIVNQPTRGPNCLDRIFINELCYCGIKVVNSAAKSDHKAVVAYTGAKPVDANKRRDKRRFRKRSPAQHAAFLEHVSQLEFEVSDEQDVQTNFNNFYDTM